MDQALPRLGNGEQRIALRRRLRHAPADQQHEIGALDARLQLRIGGEADLAGIIGVLAVEHARAAERAGDRQIESLGEAQRRPRWPARSSRRRRRWRSAARPPTASSAARPSASGPARSARPRPAARRRRRPFRSARPRAARSRPARPALHRDVIGALDDLGDLRRVRRSRSPIWSSSRRRRDSPSPGTRRGPSIARSTWPTNRIIGAQSCSAICTPCAALVAPGPRVTKQMPGRPVSRPARQRHHRRARLLSADRDLDGRIVERVERGEIGFAGHAIEALDALSDELIDENLPARAGGRRWRHETLPTASKRLGARSASSAPEFQSSPRWRRLRMRAGETSCLLK